MTDSILHHDDLLVATLASGSKGNCTYIGTETDGILVDCGLSTKQVFLRLKALNLHQSTLHGVLITHEHSDHVGAARVLSVKLRKRTGKDIPFFMSRGTRSGVRESCLPARIEEVVSGRSFEIANFQIEPWTIPHDTHDPIAYAVGYQDARAGVITDLGRSTRLVERQLSSLDIAVLEFNHDLQMLMEGQYPWRLKQRVRSAHGHLSNEQAAQVLRRGASSRLRHLVLAHLSEDNNLPEKALDAATKGLQDSAADHTVIHVATQRSPLAPLRQPTHQAGPTAMSTAISPQSPDQLSLFI